MNLKESYEAMQAEKEAEEILREARRELSRKEREELIKNWNENKGELVAAFNYYCDSGLRDLIYELFQIAPKARIVGTPNPQEVIDFNPEGEPFVQTVEWGDKPRRKLRGYRENSKESRFDIWREHWEFSISLPQNSDYFSVELARRNCPNYYESDELYLKREISKKDWDTNRDKWMRKFVSELEDAGIDFSSKTSHSS